MNACDNEICQHKANFEVQGLTKAVKCCARHLPWAVRKESESGLSVSVRQVHDERGATASIG